VKALEGAKEICHILRQGGYRAYFAGGAVRDMLLGIVSDDVDIATDATPEEIAQIFPNHVLIGAQFGVVLVLYKEQQYEVATFRSDLAYIDGRYPAHIELKSTPEEDAARRDFTINGLFFDPEKEKIYDFVGGEEDLKKGMIRTIGKPKERFSEDRLRMLRAVRFSCRFDFPIEEETREAIKEMAPQLFPAVSVERVYQELVKMCKLGCFKKALFMLFELHLLQEIFPHVKKMRNLNGVELLSGRVPMILCLTFLFQKEEYDLLAKLPAFFKASKKEIRWIEVFLDLQKEDIRAWPLWRLVKLFSEEHHFDIVFEVFCSSLDEKERTSFVEWYEGKKEELNFFVTLRKKKKRLIEAKDLLERGFVPGRELGKLLEKIERRAIEENLRDKETLLRMVEEDAF